MLIAHRRSRAFDLRLPNYSLRKRRHSTDSEPPSDISSTSESEASDYSTIDSAACQPVRCDDPARLSPLGAD